MKLRSLSLPMAKGQPGCCRLVRRPHVDK